MTPLPSNIQWSNLALLRLSAYGFGMIGFLLAMDTVILPVLVLEVSPENLKNTYLAVLGFSGLMVAGMVQPIVGRYSDRTRSPLGRRVPYLLWGCVMVCIGLVGIGLAPSYLVLLLVWLFIQANFNVGYGPYQALIQDLVPISRIGVASSIKILSDASGSLFLIAAGGALIGLSAGPEFIDWKWVTLALLGGTLIGSTVITSITVRLREAAAAVTRGTKDLIERPATGLHPQLSWFLLSRLLIITATTAFPTYALFFLRDAVGLENPAQGLSTMVLVVGGALAITIYPAGWISDRVGRKPVILTGALGASAAAVWMLWADNAVEVMITASILGSAIGVLLSSSWALANDLGTSGKEGLHMGIVNLATIVGAASAKLMGPGIDFLNRTREGSGYDALLISCAVLFALGGILIVPLRVQASAISETQPHEVNTITAEGQQDPYSSG